MPVKFLGRWEISDARWKLLVLLFLVLYGAAVNALTGATRTDQWLLAAVIFVFGVLGKERGKLFLIDWFPFMLFWILYDLMRGVAETVRGGYINVIEPYRLEAVFFGWMTPDDIPAIWFAGWRQMHDGQWYKGVFDLISANMYTLHFAVPIAAMWVFWHTIEDRRSFYRMVYTFTVLNMSALVTFMAYPAAPPWYVTRYGFEQPGVVGLISGAAGGLAAVDAMFNVNFFVSLWEGFSPNQFAAIPSLHGAYPLAIAFFIWKKWGGRTWLFFIHPVLTWFAAVYLNQHYIIDLVIGAGYLVCAYWITDRVLMPNFFDRYVDYQKTIRTLGKGAA